MARKKKTELQIIEGDILTTKCQTNANPITLDGISGGLLDIQLKKKFPRYQIHYDYIVRNNLLSVGVLWLYKTETWQILSIPTHKRGGKKPTLKDIEAGLDKFVAMYKEKGITSIAFPLIGVGDKHFDKDQILELLSTKLSKVDIPIEIYVAPTEKLIHKGEQLELWS